MALNKSLILDAAKFLGFGITFFETANATERKGGGEEARAHQVDMDLAFAVDHKILL